MGIAALANSKSTRRSDAGPTPEINITPLVDVVLVLLIIFMVIAPALEHGERVELPAILNVDKQQKSKLDPITVTMGATGSLFLEKEALSLDALMGKLRSLHAESPDRRLVLKADGTLRYDAVRRVFQRIQDEGLTGCSLQVSQKKGQQPAAPETE